MSNYVSGKIRFVSFDEIIDMSKEEVPRNVKVEKEDFIGVWIAFRNFVQDRLDQNQNVDVFKIFTISKDEKTKAVQITFNKKWMLTKKKMQNLVNEEESFILTVGLNSHLVEKFFGGNKSIVDPILKYLMSNIEKTIANAVNSIELELRFFGSVYCFDSKINFLAIESNLNSRNEKLPQIKHLLKRQQGTVNAETNKNSKLTSTSSSVQPIKSVKFSKINQLITQDLSNFKESHLNFRNPDEEKIEKQLENTQKLKQSYKETLKSNYRIRNQQPPSGPNKDYEEFDISSHLGAKKIEFKTAKQILSDTLQINSMNSKKLPRILEEHNQTKASAIATIYNSLSPSARIGSNYTDLSKFVHLDPSRRKITVLFCGETKKRMSFQSSADPKSSENLGLNQSELYDKYINEVIQNFEVVSIPKSMIDKIKNKIKTKFQNFSSTKEDLLFDNLISEIRVDFEKSLKRIIMDYLMLNLDERKRLGFKDYESYSPKTPSFFEPSTMGIPLKTVKCLKEMLEGNLLLYSKTTNMIINCWKPLKDSYLCDVSIATDGVSINQFVENQRVVISQVHNTITINWIKQVSEIYKNYTSKLPKKSVKIFFRTMGRVLGDQIRNLIVRSVLRFRNFINSFDKSEFLSTSESIKNFFDSHSIISNSFLTLKVLEEDKHLKIEVDADSAAKDITECVSDIIKTSENIARPENFFYRLEKSSLESVSMNEKFVEETVELVERIVRKAFESLSDFKLFFEQKLTLLSEKENLLNKIDNHISAAELSKLYLSYKNMESEIVFWFPSEVPMNLLRLDLQEIKDTLVGCSKNLRIIISEYVTRQISTLSAFIIKSLKSAFDEICVRIESVEKLIEAEKWIFKFLGEELLQLESNYGDMVNWLETMMPFLQFEVDTYRQVTETRQCLCDYGDKISKERERVALEREAFERRLASKRGVVNQKGNELYLKIENIQKEGRLFWMDRIMVEIQETTLSTQDTLQEIQMINHEEILLGHDKTEFQIIEQSQKALKILELFWTSIHDWTLESKKCESVIIFKIEVERIDQKIESFEKYISEALAEFKLQSHLTADPISLGEKILVEISNFKLDFELVRFLVFEGLRPRHWLFFNKILNDEKIDVKLESNGVYYLSTLRDMNLKFVEQQLKEVYTSAQKEFLSEQKVIEIEDYINNSNFSLKLYRESSEMLVLDIPATNIMIIELESYAEDVKSMKYAPEALFFKDRVFDLNKKIEFGLEVLDVWIRLQKEWIRKEQVFRLDDITRSLPSESMTFKEAYVDFRTFVNHRKRDPSFRHICKDQLLKSSLSKILENLSMLDHKINNYMSSKVSQCPRLALLEANTLEEFICSGNSIVLINKFVSMLFPFVDELVIEDGCLIAIRSKSDSLLKLKDVIDIFNFKGSGTQWIVKLEEIIRREVKKAIIEALQDYGLKSKTTFVVNKTPQSCVLAYQIANTFEIENSLNIGGSSLEELLVEIETNVQEMSDSVDKIYKIDLLSYEMLLLVILRSRDLVMNLMQMGVETTNDFEWQINQKYFWEQSGSLESDNARVQIFDTTKIYGYDFLDFVTLYINSQQSAKYCIISAMAFKEHKGLILMGKQRLGKTTLFIELASSYGYAPIVFNLGRDSTQSDINRMLVGGVGSQGWLLFNNIDLLSESAVSYLAQNLMNLQDAIIKQKQDLNINGILVKLPRSVSYFGSFNDENFKCSNLNIGKTFRRVIFNEMNISKQLALILQVKGFTNYNLLAGNIQELKKRGRLAFRNHPNLFLSISDIFKIISIVMQQKSNEANKIAYEEEMFGQSIMIFYSSNYSLHDLNILKFFIKESFYLDLNNFGNVESLDSQAKPKGVSESEKVAQSGSEIESVELNLLVKSLKMITQTFRVIVLHGDQGSGKSYLLDKVFELGSNKNYVENLNCSSFRKDQMTLSPDLSGTSVIKNSIMSVCFNNPETEYQNRLLVINGKVSERLMESLISITHRKGRVVSYKDRLVQISSNFYIIVETSDVLSYTPDQLTKIGVLRVKFDTPTRINRCVNWLYQKSLFPSNNSDQFYSFFELIEEPILDAWSKIQTTSTVPLEVIMTQVLNYSDVDIKLLQENAYNMMDTNEKVELVDQILLSNLCLVLGSITPYSQHKLVEMAIKKTCQFPDKSLSVEQMKNYRKINLPSEGSVLQMYFVLSSDNKKGAKSLKGSWNKLENLSFELLSKNDSDDFKTLKLVEQSRSLLLMEKAVKTTGKSIIMTGPNDSGKTFLLSKLRDLFQSQECKAVMHSVTSSSRDTDIVEVLNKNLVYDVKTGVLQSKSKNGKGVFLFDDIDSDQTVNSHKCINEIIYTIIREKYYVNTCSENLDKRQVKNVQVIATMSSNSFKSVNTRVFDDVVWIPLNQIDDSLIQEILVSQVNQIAFEEEGQDVLKKLPALTIELFQEIRRRIDCSFAFYDNIVSFKSMRKLLRLLEQNTANKNKRINYLTEFVALFIQEVLMPMTNAKDQEIVMNECLKSVVIKIMNVSLESVLNSDLLQIPPIPYISNDSPNFVELEQAYERLSTMFKESNMIEHPITDTNYVLTNYIISSLMSGGNNWLLLHHSMNTDLMEEMVKLNLKSRAVIVHYANPENFKDGLSVGKFIKSIISNLKQGEENLIVIEQDVLRDNRSMLDTLSVFFSNPMTSLSIDDSFLAHLNEENSSLSNFLIEERILEKLKKIKLLVLTDDSALYNDLISNSSQFLAFTTCMYLSSKNDLIDKQEKQSKISSIVESSAGFDELRTFDNPAYYNLLDIHQAIMAIASRNPLFDRHEGDQLINKFLRTYLRSLEVFSVKLKTEKDQYHKLVETIDLLIRNNIVVTDNRAKSDRILENIKGVLENFTEERINDAISNLNDDKVSDESISVLKRFVELRFKESIPKDKVKAVISENITIDKINDFLAFLLTSKTINEVLNTGFLKGVNLNELDDFAKMTYKLLIAINEWNGYNEVANEEDEHIRVLIEEMHGELTNLKDDWTIKNPLVNDSISKTTYLNEVLIKSVCLTYFDRLDESRREEVVHNIGLMIPEINFQRTEWISNPEIQYSLLDTKYNSGILIENIEIIKSTFDKNVFAIHDPDMYFYSYFTKNEFLVNTSMVVNSISTLGTDLTNDKLSDKNYVVVLLDKAISSTEASSIDKALPLLGNNAKLIMCYISIDHLISQKESTPSFYKSVKVINGVVCRESFLEITKNLLVVTNSAKSSKETLESQEHSLSVRDKELKGEFLEILQETTSASQPVEINKKISILNKVAEKLEQTSVVNSQKKALAIQRNAERILKSSLSWFPDIVMNVYQQVKELRASNPFNTLMLDSLMKIIVKTKSDIPELAVEQAESFLTEVIINLNSFLDTASVKEISFNLLVYLELRKLDVSIHEYKKIMDTCFHDNTDTSNEFLLHLIQQICSVFPNFIDSLTSISTIVLDPFRKEDISPDQFNLLPPLIRLLLGLVYYSEWRFMDKKTLFISWTSERIFKLLKMSTNISAFIKDGSVFEPVLIQSTDLERTLKKIERGGQVNSIITKFYQKSNFNRSNLDGILKDALEKGFWITFYEFALSDDVIVHLLKAMERTDGNKVNSNVRVVIIVGAGHSTELNIAHLLTRKAIQGSPRTFKEILLNYINIMITEYSDVFDNSPKRVELMQISNLLILFFATIKAQQSLNYWSQLTLTEDSLHNAILLASYYLNTSKTDIRQDEFFVSILMEYAIDFGDSDVFKDRLYDLLNRFISNEVLTSDSIVFKYFPANQAEQDLDEIPVVQFAVLSKKINLDFVESLSLTNVATILNMSHLKFQTLEYARHNSGLPASLKRSVNSIAEKTSNGNQGSFDKKETISIAKEVLKTLPGNVDLGLIVKKYPLNLNELLSNTIHAEIKTFNNQLNHTRIYFEEIIRLSKGVGEASGFENKSLVDLLSGVVPSVICSSNPPIAQFVAGIQRCHKYLQQWSQSGGLQTLIFPLIGRPEMFLLFMKIENAKRKGLSVNDVSLIGEFILEDQTLEKLPESEFYVSEVYLNCATIDNALKSLNYSGVSTKPIREVVKLKVKAISNNSMENISEKINYASIPLYLQPRDSQEKTYLDTIMLPSLISPNDLLYLDIALTYSRELN